MSWLRELEDANAKQTGRDFVFRKMEGGVAAKLAAFENKASGGTSGAVTPAGGRMSRSNSITSRVSSSEHYGIEGGRLSRRTTTDQPGNVSDVVDASFKKKLEGLTGTLANKIQQQGGETATSVRGPAAMAAARKKIPQDVLDFISLSGIDPEVAINEYLQTGALGKTKDWEHDEVLRQIGDLEHHTPKSPRSPQPQATEEKAEVKAGDDKKNAGQPEEVKEEPATPQVVETKESTAAAPVMSPVIEESIKDATSPTKDAAAAEEVKPVEVTSTPDIKEVPTVEDAKAVPEVESQVESAPKEEIKAAAFAEKQLESSEKTPSRPGSGMATGMSFIVTQPTRSSNEAKVEKLHDEETSSFNAAALPRFG